MHWCILVRGTTCFLQLTHPFCFRSHTCITFELLSINLYELIKKNKFQGFSLQLVRKFAHSLLQCLDTLYRNKIIHCDMKPENVLLKQQGRSGIKVRQNPFLFAIIENNFLAMFKFIIESCIQLDNHSSAHF